MMSASVCSTRTLLGLKPTSIWQRLSALPRWPFDPTADRPKWRDRVKATRGPNFYEEIGRKGGQKVKKLIEEGKRAAKEAAAKEAHAKEQSSEAPVQSAER